MLTFDPDSEARIRALWQVLGEAGLPALGNSGWQPHITLAAFTTARPLEVHRALAAVFENVASFELQLEGIGSFPRRGVLYLNPTLTSHLLGLQASLYASLASQVTFGEPFYAPDHWSPHCTLTLGASARELGLALELLVPRWQPFSLRVEGVHLLHSEDSATAANSREIAYKAFRNPNIA